MNPITRLLRLIVIITVLAAAGQSARAAGLLPELDASSPAATLRSLRAEAERIEALYNTYQAMPTTATELAMAHGMQRIGTQLLDLHEIAPATRLKSGAAAAGYLADILARLPEIPPESIPGDPGRPGSDLPAHWTIPGTEIRIVRLADGPRAGNYVFSADTVARLPEFHAQAAEMPALQPNPPGGWVTVQQRFVGPWLARLPLDDLPAALQAPLLGTPVWKLLLSILLGLAILAVVLHWWGTARRWTAAVSLWRRHALMLTVPGLLAALVVLGHGFIMWQVVPAHEIANAETILTTMVLYLAAAWAAVRACWLLAEVVIASPAFPDSTYDAHLVRIVARVGSLLAAGTIIVYGANDIGVPALGLLAGVSIGGIALALAAQSTVENLLGGITIFADRPFRVGDEVSISGNSGKVEAIGPRSTRIRGSDGTITTMPNAVLAKASLTNVSTRPSSVVRHRISLPGDLPSRQLEALLAELRERVRAHPLVEEASGLPRVRVVGLVPTGG